MYTPVAISGAEESPYRSELELLFQSVWDDFTFEGYPSDIPLPVAAISDGKVTGGLAFTLYKEPDGECEVIWLNALFVLPEFRGKGVASELIKIASGLVSDHGQKTLYAYTDVPALYEALGWHEIQAQAGNGHKVMGIGTQVKF